MNTPHYSIRRNDIPGRKFPIQPRVQTVLRPRDDAVDERDDANSVDERLVGLTTTRSELDERRDGDDEDRSLSVFIETTSVKSSQNQRDVTETKEGSNNSSASVESATSKTTNNSTPSNYADEYLRAALFNPITHQRQCPSCSHCSQAPFPSHAVDIGYDPPELTTIPTDEIIDASLRLPGQVEDVPIIADSKPQTFEEENSNTHIGSTPRESRDQYTFGRLRAKVYKRRELLRRELLQQVPEEGEDDSTSHSTSRAFRIKHTRKLYVPREKDVRAGDTESSFDSNSLAINDCLKSRNLTIDTKVNTGHQNSNTVRSPTNRGNTVSSPTNLSIQSSFPDIGVSPRTSITSADDEQSVDHCSVLTEYIVKEGGRPAPSTVTVRSPKNDALLSTIDKSSGSQYINPTPECTSVTHDGPAEHCLQKNNLPNVNENGIQKKSDVPVSSSPGKQLLHHDSSSCYGYTAAAPDSYLKKIAPFMCACAAPIDVNGNNPLGGIDDSLSNGANDETELSVPW